MTNHYSKDFRFILDSLTNRLHEKYGLGESFRQLVAAKNRLVEIARRDDTTKNIIQTKAALILTAQKLSEGLNVEVERRIPDEHEVLVGDLYCSNPGYSELIEVETGTIPSLLILEKKITEDEAQLARVIGKIVRYSYNGHSKHFGLAVTTTPATNLDLVMPALQYFHEDFRKRDPRKTMLELMMSTTRTVYDSPPLNERQFEHAHLDRLYSIDTSKMSVERIPL